MARLEELQGRLNALTTRYLTVSRGLTRVPPGSRLAGLQRGTMPGAGPAGGNGGGTGPVTISPGSPGRSFLTGGLAATEGPRLRERVAGMLPSLPSTIPSSVLTAAGGAAPTASTLASAATTAGGGAGVAGGGLAAAQSAAAAADVYGQAGNLLVGGAGFTPLIGPALSFLPLLWGGTPLSPFSFLTGLGDRRPTAQSRADQALRGSQLSAASALRGAQTPETINAIIGPLAGTTGATVTDPASIARLFSDTSTFGSDLGGSSRNIAQMNLLDAIARTMPTPAGMVPAGTSFDRLNALPPPLRALHPDVVHTNAVRRGISGERGYFDISEAIPTLAGDAEGQARAMARLAQGATLAEIQLGAGGPRHVEGVHPSLLFDLFGPGTYSTPAGFITVDSGGGWQWPEPAFQGGFGQGL